MFQKVIEIDKDSYIEIATRIVEGAEIVCMMLRARTDNGRVMAIGALLDEEECHSVVKAITEALESRRDPASLVAQNGDKV